MKSITRHCVASATVLAAATFAGSALAAGSEGVKIFGGDFSMNGFVRMDLALSTSSESSSVNQYGDPANGVAINRVVGNPIGVPGVSQPWELPLTGGLGGVLSTLGVGLPVGPFAPTAGVTNLSATGDADTVTRYVQARDPDMNYHQLRMELTPSIRWGDISLITRLRAVYDPGDFGYRDFDYGDFTSINGGIEGGVPKQFHAKVNHLGYHVEGDDRPLFFEYSDRNFMVDLPAFFLQWTNGQSTLRVGNQSVAWGQLLFFRLMDVANGLDLRRHLFIDRAIEEFADERMSAPGIRFTHQISNEIVFDSFAQQFVPSVLMNVNTPYNVVPSQFTIRDRYVENGYDEKIDAGFRIKAEYGSYNLQFMYTSRHNHLGSIRWTKSRINKALPDSNLLGAAFNIACSAALIDAYNARTDHDDPVLASERVDANGNSTGCGPLLARSAFEASPAGVFSAEEWFNYAGYIKLDGLDGLDAAIDDFPAAQGLLAAPVDRNMTAADNQLDGFFSAGEGLRGHIERDYYREDIFGIGGGIVTNAEPGSFFDQIVINLEATYAKDRVFTPIDLSFDYDIRDEYQVGLVVEKYHRFTQSLPAVYMVFQYLWQKESDLAGLLLDGYGSENYRSPNNPHVNLNPKVPVSTEPNIIGGIPGIDEGANYIVLAALQPGQAYVFEYSIATLIDIQGGVLAQPAVQWKPRGNLTVNLFYNYIEADAWGGNANKNLMSLIDFADEVVLRLSYQF